ncbi:hypothetical protein [Ekhidna sp.]
MKWQYFLLLIIFNFCTQRKEELPLKVDDFSNPSGSNSSLPYLIKGNDDQLYLSWVEKIDSNQVLFKYAILNSANWSEPELIAQGTDWFVNWADYPMIAIDSAGNKLAHYLAKSSEGTYSYDINLVMKAKDSANWSTSIIPHDDGTPTEHGFVTMLPVNDGTFNVAWLDGRNTANNDHNHHGGSGAMSLRTALVDLRGNIMNESELDNRICDCCQTSGAMTKDGPIFVYRDRSVDEVRDMAFVSKTNEQWSTPKLISQDNWNITGCPVNGPRMASYENTVVVAWYTAALNRPKIKVAFKSGSEFQEAMELDNTSPVGRTDIVMINEEKAIVSWLDGGDQPAIKYRSVTINGTMSPVYVVSEISIERGSGFPQMELHNGSLYFAWTEIGEQSQIRMKKVALPN